MRVLVTGSTGFVGKRVVKVLLDRGFQVRCLVRRIPILRDEQPLAGLNVELAQGSVLEPLLLEQACSNVQAVVHLVAIIRESRGNTFELINHQGTRNIAQAALKSSVGRFVHISAVGVTSDTRFPYLRSKWLGEQAIIKSGLPYTILRGSILFGEGDEFINTLAGLVRSFPVVPIAGSGRALYQPLHVEDFASCIARCVHDTKFVGQSYELGGPHVLSYNNLVALIAQTYAVRRLIVHIPLPLMKLAIALMERAVPRPPATSQQLKMVTLDNVPNPNRVAEFGFQPRPLQGNIDYIRRITFADGLKIALGFMPLHIRAR